MNSIVRLSLIYFFLNKVLTGPMNSTRDPLENHNFAFSSCTGLTMHVKRSSQRIKKKKKNKLGRNTFQCYPNEGKSTLAMGKEQSLLLNGCYMI